ncbi:MAG TPA: hypothetical protein VKU38_07125 [Ktedonobacteraceae bacterium]|nr:hypothetical protein [Ktedonobacteraceae bacterium]
MVLDSTVYRFTGQLLYNYAGSMYIHWYLTKPGHYQGYPRQAEQNPQQKKYRGLGKTR